MKDMNLAETMCSREEKNTTYGTTRNIVGKIYIQNPAARAIPKAGTSNSNSQQVFPTMIDYSGDHFILLQKSLRRTCSDDSSDIMILHESYSSAHLTTTD
jgi:hypothetical protein